MCWLKGIEIMKIFIPIIIFYGNKNVCLGFVRLLLKIMLVWKGVMCMFGGWGKMCGICVLFKVVKNVKVYKWKTVLLHTTMVVTEPLK